MGNTKLNKLYFKFNTSVSTAGLSSGPISLPQWIPFPWDVSTLHR